MVYGTRSMPTTVTQANSQQYPPSPSSPKSPAQSDGQYIGGHRHDSGC